MELQHSPKPSRTHIKLENDTEARLFAREGLGLFSIRGLRLALNVVEAQNSDEWPVEVTISNRRLNQARDRMHEEAARLGVMQMLNGFGDYPDAVEDELALREMVAAIDGSMH